jgi:hypothetical protein
MTKQMQAAEAELQNIRGQTSKRLVSFQAAGSTRVLSHYD